MRTLGDAIALRNRIIRVMEEADFECASGNRHDLLTVLVAGGGFAGVETIAAVNDFMHDAMPYYPHLTANDMRVVLVEGGPRILSELSPRLSAYTQRQLEKRGVEVRPNTSVVRASNGTVDLSDGTNLRARTIVWTAGNTMNPILKDLPCTTARGRIMVDEFLRVEGWNGVWALGDCAAIPDCESNGFYPPTAQHALREAKVASHNIAAELRGGPLKAFSFRTIGQLAAVGRRAGVANILGINFSGFVAWWLWRTIYLSKLPRLERKIRVALDWTLDLFLSKDIVQFQNVPGPTVSQVEVTQPVEHPLAS